MNGNNYNILPDVKYTIAVASGKGGVGKSTVAVNIAMSLLNEGLKVGLIDADIYGPSIPMMLGINEQPQVTKIGDKTRLLPVVKNGLKLMSIGFLIEANDAVVWRGPMAASALKQFISDVEWGKLDYLIYDMPPGTGDIQLTLTQTIPLTGAVIVTTPQDISLADARKGARMFEKVNVPVLGIVENMSYYINPDGTREYIFGQGGGTRLSKELGINFLGEIAINTRIRVAGDEGNPIVIKEPSLDVSSQFNNIARNIDSLLKEPGRNTQKPEIEISL
ncbi:MAG: Mrp/NBP35 family ATP-binding protein [Ignavibacteria bacterium]